MRVVCFVVFLCLLLGTSCSRYSYDFPSAEIRRSLNPETTPQYSSIVFYMKFDGNFIDSIFSLSPTNSIDLPSLFSPTFSNSLGARFSGAQRVKHLHSLSHVYTTGFSLQAWVYANSMPISGEQCMVSKRDLSWGFNFCNFSGVNTMGLVILNSGAPNNVAVAPFSLTGRWIHLVATADSSGGKIYSNGFLVNTSSIAFFSPTNSGNITIGADAYTGVHFFDGDIDEVAIWNTVLSASEVQELYRQQAP